jgi:hypothetical protein
MNKLFLLIPAAAGIFLSGCVDEPYYGRVAYDRPAYYGRDYGPGYAPADRPDYGPDYAQGDYGADYGPDYYGPSGEIDFYYVGGRPYSRYYGPLIFRDNNYYFNSGGSLGSYDVEFGRHHSFRHGGGYAGRGGYATTHGGSSSSRGGYTTSHGGYAAPHGGYPISHGGYAVPHGGYAAPQGGYTVPHGGYTASHAGYAAPQGGYPISHGGFVAPHGGQLYRGSGAVPGGVQRPGVAPQKGQGQKKNKDESH